MSLSSSKMNRSDPEFLPFGEKHYRDFKRKNIIRLFLTYIVPLILLAIFFNFQYGSIKSESWRLHLEAIAENQANTFDLFLSERIVNLSNLINEPEFQSNPDAETMKEYLQKLKGNSDAFVDIGYFNDSGIQTSYEGPYPSLEQIDYSSEAWYMELRQKDDGFIITDIYFGFRQKPHFTIAVRRIIDDQFIVLRATLDPKRIYDYISSLKGSGEVSTSIVNKDGFYQLVKPDIGNLLEASLIIPPQSPKLGVADIKIKGSKEIYAYSWLRNADWALIIQRLHPEERWLLSTFQLKTIGISAVMILISLVIVLSRAKKLVEFQIDSDRTRAELGHAAKLASVGELASGIAHEINNPLAIISEEAGLMKDLMNPEFKETASPDESIRHLNNIQEAVFRCRDITRKLLKFVRKTEMELKPHNVHQLIDGVVDGLLGQEIAVSNIEIIKNFADDVPQLLTDGNQLQQVLLNLLNNSFDAITDSPGRVIITTSCENNSINIKVADNGRGIAPDQLDKLFLPFYTTKEVGKGTGLGLSVSYGIIKNLGGKISAESRPGKGSTFTIVLPIH